MKTFGFAVFLVCLFFMTGFAQVQESYPPHPDSVAQPGVPKGEVLKFSFDRSKIFPGTWREYWVYIPAQYNPQTPACVYVNQDGIQWEAPTVFDNLIARKEMPVTIGVFVMHGKVRAQDSTAQLDRFNRSYEYDGLGDSYVRFLLEELLPDVETKKATDGRQIRLSKSGNDRAIGGSSSGAICAFNAAWERPDAFSRVFSAIGTYVGLRGADRFHSLVRKYEPKPIRIFMQDGSNDLNIYGGDWWMANQTLERALTWSGYEVSHVWGEGAHNGKQGTAVFPDAMRYLWKDWPKPVTTHATKNDYLNAILIPGEGWQLAGEGYGFTEGTVADASGKVYFTDVRSGNILKIQESGPPAVFAGKLDKPSGQAFGPDGSLYTVLGSRIIKTTPNGKQSDLVTDLAGNDLVVSKKGFVYITSPPPTGSADPSKVWMVSPDGKKTLVDEGLKFSNGITLSPDQSLLYIADFRSHWVYSYQVQPDGTLAHKQKYYWLQVPDTADDSGADGIRTDTDGRLYVATRMGIQICDQAGRVNAIIPTPNGRIANLTFGGNDFSILYAACGDKVYFRKVKTHGANAWAAPVKPTPPRL